MAKPYSLTEIALLSLRIKKCLFDITPKSTVADVDMILKVRDLIKDQHSGGGK